MNKDLEKRIDNILDNYSCDEIINEHNEQCYKNNLYDDEIFTHGRVLEELEAIAQSDFDNLIYQLDGLKVWNCDSDYYTYNGNGYLENIGDKWTVAKDCLTYDDELLEIFEEKSEN